MDNRNRMNIDEMSEFYYEDTFLQSDIGIYLTERLRKENWQPERRKIAITKWDKLKPFAPDGNQYEDCEPTQLLDNDAHYVMRLVGEYYLARAFNALKIDLSDVNVRVDAETGNIGTCARIIKMWSGSNLDDTDELLSGRWNKSPRMASFDTTSDYDSPLWIKTQVRAVCSHHVIGFHDVPADKDSFVVVGYIPENGKMGGISKISRIVNYASRRLWLQESLTEYIAKLVAERFETTSVFVAMINISHGCSWTRGANDNEARTTTFYSTGQFKEDRSLIPERFKGL